MAEFFETCVVAWKNLQTGAYMYANDMYSGMHKKLAHLSTSFGMFNDSTSAVLAHSLSTCVCVCVRAWVCVRVCVWVCVWVCVCVWGGGAQSIKETPGPPTTYF